MIMEATSEQAFNAYLKLAQAKLRPQGVGLAEPQPIQLLETRSMELRRLVDGIEESPELSELVTATATAFPCETVVHRFRGSQEVPVQREDIKNFFRRSRCYMSLFSGEDVDAKAALESFRGVFRKEEIQIRYLVAPGGINFQLDADVVEFERFKLRRFSSEELEEIFQNDVNDIFYQSNTLSRSDLMFSEPYWFIDVLGFESREEGVAKSDEINHDFLPSVEEEFGAFPKTVASVLDPFILCDWDSFDPLSPAFEFNVPFILEISNDLRDEPRRVPEIVPMCGGDGDYDIDWDVELDNGQLNSFQRFIADMDSILTRLRSAQSKWRFLDAALLFLRYSFVSKGRQQLLSHITVLEALIGEDKAGQAKLKQRLACLLGSSEQERKAIKKSFEEIYDLRSRLVHGDEEMLNQKTSTEHLRQARTLARQTLVWFLHYLEHVLDATRNNENLPTREDLLSVLDLNTESRERVNIF